MNFWMLPLCTIVTDLRLFSSAYLIAMRTRRLVPVIEIGLMPMPESSRMRLLVPASILLLMKSISSFACAVPCFHSMPA